LRDFVRAVAAEMGAVIRRIPPENLPRKEAEAMRLYYSTVMDTLLARITIDAVVCSPVLVPLEMGVRLSEQS
jgi:hypothetical protein